ncbi:MipA/OmpV family protein [Lonsdalea quercina]|uniref:MipA/OmpV family protein n=1 Tax=Lonsdalea quercina TaxID=71657 RepID=UPI003F51C914
MKKLQSVGVALALSVTATLSAQAETFSLGVGAIGETSVYRGDDNHIYPFPQVVYESDNFYFRGLGGGYYLWNDEQNKLSLTAYYNPFGFKPGDSDDGNMKQLDKRRGTLMGGVAYRHDAQWGTIRSVLAADTLGNSDGVVWDTAYLYRIDADQWYFTPGIGVNWSSARQNRYYYGVSNSESARSGIQSYRPGDSWDPYLELSVGYTITPRWNTWIIGRYTRLSDEVKSSPMVEKSDSLMLGGGISYAF